MPDPNLQGIIEKAMMGDQYAFRTLVETFQQFVYSIAMRLTGNTDESEDLTQEAFIRLWSSRSKFNTTLSMKAWLGKIITNLCLDYIKSSRHKHHRNSLSIEHSFAKPSEKNPESELEAEELHALIMHLSENLTPKQRAVFVLRDLERFEVDEVCEMLQMSAENVKSNLYHARTFIKSRLLKIYTTEKNGLQRE